VKFIFATTEIRKVPITVLSRCQRFDLKRVDGDILVAHFARIAAAESAEIEPEALALIARAADGSVRDGLSLLDQAIARGAGAVTAEQVRDMLGLADRAVVLDLYEAAMGGDAKAALDILGRLHAAGAEGAIIVEDLLDLTHRLTRLRLAPGAATHGGDLEARRGAALAERLGMPVLTRAWQLLLKGLEEIRIAPNPQAAAEMIVLRLAFAADLPAPAELVRRLEGSIAGDGAGPPPQHAPRADPGGPRGGPATMRAMPLARAEIANEPVAALSVEMPAPPPPTPALPTPSSFREVVRLFAEKKEGVLEYHLRSSVRLVRFEPGVIEFSTLPQAPPNLANRVGSLLSDWTGRRWVIGISAAPGEETLADVDRALMDASLESAKANPVVQALMAAFPGAVISEVRDLAQTAPHAEDLLRDDVADDDFAGGAGELPLEGGDES
jgi:DNA polymerase-3 subunit gamma/tau